MPCDKSSVVNVTKDYLNIGAVTALEWHSTAIHAWWLNIKITRVTAFR